MRTKRMLSSVAIRCAPGGSEADAREYQPGPGELRPEAAEVVAPDHQEVRGLLQPRPLPEISAGDDGDQTAEALRIAPVQAGMGARAQGQVEVRQEPDEKRAPRGAEL